MQQGYLKAANADTNDELGNGLAISDNGDVVAATSVNEASNSADNPNDNSVEGAGAAHVFRRTSGIWGAGTLVKPLQPRDSGFGMRVALSGDGTLLTVGAITDASHGAAILFAFDNARWQQTAKLVPAPGGFPREASEGLGWNVAMSANGQFLAAAAPRESTGASGFADETTNTRVEASGAVAVFERSADGWKLRRVLKEITPRPVGAFGDDSGLAVRNDGKSSQAISTMPAIQLVSGARPISAPLMPAQYFCSSTYNSLQRCTAAARAVQKMGTPGTCAHKASRGMRAV